MSRTADIAEMNPVRNGPETFPGRRDNIVSVPLSCDDAMQPVSGLGEGLILENLSQTARC